MDDALWLVVQIPLMLLTISLGGGSVWLLIAWAAGGHLAALVGLAQARTWAGRPGLVRPWLVEHKSLWPYYTLDNMLRQAAMVAVMTMTPLHMRDHGQAELSGTVIALHVLGMFGLSPVVGRIVDRYGPLRSIRLGAAILGIGVVAAVIAGYQPALIFAGLCLLGLGWSFGLIGGSSLLVAASGDEYRVASQGLADAVLSVLGGSAAFASGFVKESFGFHWLSNVAFVLALAVGLWASVRLRSGRAMAEVGGR